MYLILKSILNLILKLEFILTKRVWFNFASLHYKLYLIVILHLIFYKVYKFGPKILFFAILVC